MAAAGAAAAVGCCCSQVGDIVQPYLMEHDLVLFITDSVTVAVLPSLAGWRHRGAPPV
jgi:hypothetical protein